MAPPGLPPKAMTLPSHRRLGEARPARLGRTCRPAFEVPRLKAVLKAGLPGSSRSPPTAVDPMQPSVLTARASAMPREPTFSLDRYIPEVGQARRSSLEKNQSPSAWGTSKSADFHRKVSARTSVCEAHCQRQLCDAALPHMGSTQCNFSRCRTMFLLLITHCNPGGQFHLG